MPQVFNPACHPINVTGLTDIQVAVPYTGALQKLGHATDMVEQEARGFFHDVPGDRNGGPQGPPIEVQFLGEIYIVNFAMSSFSRTVADVLEARAIKTSSGVIQQAAVGSLVLAGKSVRLLLHNLADTDTINFWCAFVRQPWRMGRGTKFSELVLSFECHRPPCGHPKAGIIWDRDSDAYAP